MNATLDLAKLYEEYKEDIVRLAKRYSRCSQWDVEELVADGSLTFIKVVQSYKPEHGDLKKRITFLIWKGWQTKSRVERTKYRKEKGSKYLDQENPDIATLDNASEDADTLIRVALDPPLDVLVTADIIKRSYSQMAILRMAIVDYLLDMGWALERIEEGFQEVRDILNG